MTIIDTEMTPEMREELDRISSETKKGFDLTARLKGRGLRRGTVTLFLDDEKGLELGWAHDLYDQLGNVVRHDRAGVMGDLEIAEERLAKERDEHDELQRQAVILNPEYEPTDYDATDLAEHIAKLTEMRDKLVKELFETAITINMRAVPPVIEKNSRRKARQTLGIKSKNIPVDLQEDFDLSRTAHLMTEVFLSIKDHVSGEVNDTTTYDDAIDLMGYLPLGQWQRLDAALGRVQFTDAISRNIEGQEDFS